MDLTISKQGVKLKISNISFQFITAKTKAKKSYEQVLLTNGLINKKIFEQDICRDSFIPKTNIKIHPLYEKNRNILNKPLHPAQLTYSKFPVRKSKPKRRMSSAAPVYRQKIFSFANGQINDKMSTITSFQNDKKMRASTKSCGPIRGRESLQQNFMRYSNIQLLDSKLDRKAIKTAININIQDKDILPL